MANAIRFNLAVLDRLGYPGPKSYDEYRATVHRSQDGRFIHNRSRSKARRFRPGHVGSYQGPKPAMPQVGKRLRVNAWTFGTKADIRQCRWCSKLLWVWTSPKSAKPDFHHQCWVELLRSEDGAAWWREWRRLKRKGLDREAVSLLRNPPVPKRMGRPAGNLTRDFGWAVRYLIGGEQQKDLAVEAGVDVATVSRGVASIRKLLPDPQKVGSRRFRGYVELMLAADT